MGIPKGKDRSCSSERAPLTKPCAQSGYTHITSALYLFRSTHLLDDESPSWCV